MMTLMTAGSPHPDEISMDASYRILTNVDVFVSVSVLQFHKCTENFVLHHFNGSINQSDMVHRVICMQNADDNTYNLGGAAATFCIMEVHIGEQYPTL